MPTYHQFIKEENSKERRKCNGAFIRIGGNMCDGAVFVMEVRFSTGGNADWIHARLKEVAPPPPTPPSHRRLCIIKKLILEAVIH